MIAAYLQHILNSEKVVFLWMVGQKIINKYIFLLKNNINEK